MELGREVTIGRAPDSDILYGAEYVYVSNNHAMIYSDGKQMFYQDFSSNGTIVNGRRVHQQTVVINYGDSILLAGRCELSWEQISIFFPNVKKATVLNVRKTTILEEPQLKWNIGLPNTSSGQVSTPSLSFGQAVSNVFSHYADFTGRARRSEYWWFVLLNVILSWIPYLGMLWGLVAILPGLAVCVRRLHDVGKSGWYYFVVLIPIVGLIMMVVWLCQDSEYGDNKYGENPKYVKR